MSHEHEAKREPTVQAAADTAPSGDPANVIAYLLAGPLTFGGIGWALDHWLSTSFFIVVGLLAGLAMAFYIIWIRYGKA